MISRVVGWELQLDRYATSMLRRPFRWGVSDCASLAIGGLRAVYGPACPVPRPRYRTLRGAMRFFASLDGRPGAYMAARGAIEVDRAFVQAGDVLVCMVPDDVGLPRLALASDASMILMSHAAYGVMAAKLHSVALPFTCWRF